MDAMAFGDLKLFKDCPACPSVRVSLMIRKTSLNLESFMYLLMEIIAYVEKKIEV